MYDKKCILRRTFWSFMQIGPSELFNEKSNLRSGFVESNNTQTINPNITVMLKWLLSYCSMRSAAIFNVCIQTWRRGLPLCSRWFLETSDPYLPPYQRAQTCHKVHYSLKIRHIGPRLSTQDQSAFCINACHDSVKRTHPVNTSIRFHSHNAQPKLKLYYHQYSLVSHTYFRSQMNQSMHHNVADDSRTKQNFSWHKFSTHARLLRPNKKNPMFWVTLLTFKIRVGRSASLFLLLFY